MRRGRLAEDLSKVLNDTFRSLFGVGVKPQARRVLDSPLAPFGISSIIGVTGDFRGAFLLSIPTEMAIKITSRMMEGIEDEAFLEENITDCVGETANIVVGNLLPMLGNGGSRQCSFSLPSVVIGNHRVVWRREDMPYELLTFTTDIGSFSVGISIKEDGKRKKKTAYNFMLVDDSRLMRMMLLKALRESGLAIENCVEAGDGKSALDALEDIDYSVDAVFCDLQMPVLDGHGFLGALRNRGKLKSCPVIVVTGETSDERSREAIRNGASAVIGKPFTAERVRDILLEVL
jgi:two-component system chemotaxis response regulator CheY